ncbi:DMT family transporter [Photobacterium sp. 1_MG-2023]|uniref:DMT family transporter n=1 Tax=Photobacterium sp. 1_MG-2023 TaxID=3062646 RepID=UPI0026E33422|nr:DMT family transporter [Photobacterium sp. 1_MG-2023]MDO6708935.1 DMT family transporter [Photobacterium sp. 1_MG-2023]
MDRKHWFGVILALLAAFFNGMVGIFSVSLFQSGMPPEAVAFYKCVVAFLMIVAVLVATEKVGTLLAYLKEKWKALIVCSFFGFFMLYFFETAAYETLNVAVVVFLLFGVSTLVTFFANAVFERRNLTGQEWMSVLFAVLGLYLIFMENEHIEASVNTGFMYAVLAGIGYGLFLVLNKKLNIGGGLIPVCGLLLFGLVYLMIPFTMTGLVGIDPSVWLTLVLLALLPTIGGFWCTTKSLTILKSQTVQLVELSEPIFALMLGFVFLGQLVTPMQMLGGACILAAILIHEVRLSFFRKNKMAADTTR